MKKSLMKDKIIWKKQWKKKKRKLKWKEESKRYRNWRIYS